MRKTFKLFSFLALFAFIGILVPVMAQTTDTAASAAATPVVTVNGLVDAYYSYNFNNPGVGTNNGAYWYNSASDSYSLGLAEAKFTATQGQTSAHLVMAYGQEAYLGLFPGFDVLQAYVSYNPGQFTFDFGRFVKWMGYETLESTGNANYSHSLLFNTLADWYTGMSVNYTPCSCFNVTGYVTDGNNATAATSVGKTYGLQAVYTADSTLNFTFDGILGPTVWGGYFGANGTPTVGSAQTSDTGELIIGYKPSSSWSFALDTELGANSVPKGGVVNFNEGFFGVGLYGKYQIQSDWDVALRLEYLSDSYNDMFNIYGNDNAFALGNAFNADEVTLTIEHDFTANMIARLEGRMDMASYNGTGANVFTNGSTPTDTLFTGTASVAFTF